MSRFAAARLRACSKAISAVISPPIRIGLSVVPAPFVDTDDCFFALHCFSCSAASLAVLKSADLQTLHDAPGGGGFALFALFKRAAISRCFSSTSASRDDDMIVLHCPYATCSHSTVVSSLLLPTADLFQLSSSASALRSSRQKNGSRSRVTSDP